MKISAGLGGSKLDARGGIIGGCIELQQLDSEGMTHQNTLVYKTVFIGSPIGLLF